MKKLILISLFLSSLSCLSQQVKKETVYLLFDKQRNEKCWREDGSGNTLEVNKFRKEVQGEFINFKICNEIFSTPKTNRLKDTCSIKYLEKIKLVDFDYLINRYNSENDLKHHVFDKIFFIEKIPKEKIVKYEVSWIDEIILIDDR